MEKRKIEIDINTAKEWYNSNNESLKTIALQAFSEQELNGFLPKTWEECMNLLKEKDEYKELYYIDADSEIVKSGALKYAEFKYWKNSLPSKKLAEAMLALCQLLLLRDYYNDGWNPDWTNTKEYKFCIVFYLQNASVASLCGKQRLLAFPTKELAEQFLENFKDLIEKAKPLL